MHQRKSKKLLIYFFLLILISSTNNISFKNLEFQKVRNIEVSGLDEIENKLIIDQIKNLNLTNIFFLVKIQRIYENTCYSKSNGNWGYDHVSSFH